MPSDETIPRIGQIGTVFTAQMEEPNPNYDNTIPIHPTTNPEFLIVDLADDDGNSKLEMMKPNKKRITVPASVFGPTVDGKLRHTDDAGVLTMTGIWRFRGIYSTNGGQNFPGSWHQQQIGK